jgi:hypothetical protein
MDEVGGVRALSKLVELWGKHEQQFATCFEPETNLSQSTAYVPLKVLV